MLRDGLLRSKNDEIARCLLSRKRKLSELYFATVGIAGATEGAPADSLYQQKEQAFLDANDLSKGRYFNESTLPPLPNYAALIPRPQGKDAALPARELETKGRDAVDITPPSRSDNVPSSQPPAAAVDQHVAIKSQRQAEKPPSIELTQQNAEVPLQSPVPGVAHGASQALTGPTQAPAHPVRSPSPAQKVNGAVPETPLSSQDQDSTAANVFPSQIKPAPAVAVPPIKTRDILPPQKKHDMRPSLVLGPSNFEQPLSPVSSVGPYSNNTPVPVAASPDTSPAEEANDSVDKLEARSPKHDRPVQPPPNLVPSTPDEQLRLEEAQSLQQSTLTASKTIGDSFSSGGYPSSNEVIQESIGPGAAVNEEKMEVTQETAISSKTFEMKKPEQTAVTEPLTPVQLPSEPIQPPVESVIKTAAPPLTTLKKPQPAPSVQLPPQPERMTTRVSSGAIRHKSVSEILGETPKPVVLQTDKTPVSTKLTPLESPSTPPEKGTPELAARIRFKDRKEREKERTKLSTVVFPRQQPEKPDTMDLVRQNAGDIVARLNEEQDYLFTLFQSKAYAPPRGANLTTLLASAHKTLTTSNHLLEYEETMDCRILRRIYALQNANRWPLRQLKRSVEPPRQATHWDILLDHMKWMRTDFREERKWKLAAAKSCADWCAEYVNSDPEHRALLRVQTRAPSPKTAREDAHKPNMVSPPEEPDEMLGVSHPTPDLVPSTEDESVSDGFNDEPRHDIGDTVAPAAIFSLGLDEFTFSLDMTPAAEKLLDELPIYAPVKIAPDTKLPTFKALPDAMWKTDLLPVSKYASGKIRFHDGEPARKRSRYDYSQYDQEREHPMIDLPPEQTNVALFRPENKPIRDRIHPGHSFRPPTEHPMPSVGFFESRQSSQWTYTEDDELRRLVKEYSYNWSLISSCLTPPSLFTSGAERRTPWECFERWIGLEGLPADMSKTQYFRAYSQRLETAQRTVLAQQQAAQQQQQQQQGNNAQPQPPVRRRTTQPVRVDRRRSSKHLALLDAMRKLAKKRETTLQKQQHASHLASLRKVNEANQPKPPISTPAEFSRLKYERELKLQERQEQYRQQMIAQQRANMAAQRAGQMPNQQAMMNAQPGRTPNGMPHNPANPGMPGSAPNGMPAGMPPGVGVNQARPHSMQGMPPGAPVNGSMPANPMAMNMMPQSGMQQATGARPGMPMQASPDNARVIREANRLQEQQRMLQSRQQQSQQGPQQQPPQQAQQPFHNQQQFGPKGPHSPNVNMPSINGTPNNAAMMAALQAAGGMQSPSFHSTTPQGVSTPSPRMAQPNPLSGGVVPTISSIQNQIQRNNPNMTPEQVNKLATDRLHQYQQQRMSQVAMNAAAGNIGAVQANFQVPHDGNFQAPSQPGMTNGGPGIQVPQAQGYSPMMRVPQTAQQNRVPVTSSPAMNGAVPQQSRSATPQTQRSGSVQAGPAPGSSKSPRPPPAQTASS